MGVKPSRASPAAAPHQELLGHAHLVEPVGMGLSEDVQVRVLGEIRREPDEIGAGLCQLHQGMAEGCRPVRWSGPARDAIIAEVFRPMP